MKSNRKTSFFHQIMLRLFSLMWFIIGNIILQIIMKTKLFMLIILATTCIYGCKKFDDSHLWDSINNLNDRVGRLEEMCDRMNTNISSLQSIVQALENNDAIRNVSSLPNGEGYTITFVSGKTINIYNGTDGKDGSDGDDGVDGKDGITPVISVKQDADGVYYWTLNGDWLIVDGQKVKAVGEDGSDGQDGTDGEDGAPGSDGTDGKDGITPQFKIEEGYWYISYDNRQTWEQVGKATGEDGLNGADGENFFKSVSIENGYVCFILNDTESTMIKLPFVVESSLIINIDDAGSLNDLTNPEQYSTITSLKIIGNVNDDDLKCIHARFVKLEYLDMGESVYNGQSQCINPWKDLIINRTINTIVLPNQEIQWNCDYMQNLETIYVTNGKTIINGHTTLKCAPYISYVHYMDGISSIKGGVPHPQNCHVIYPASLNEIDSYIFVCKDSDCRNIRISDCTIYAKNPPAVSDADGFVTRVESYPLRGKINCILYFEFFKLLYPKVVNI